MQRSDTNFALLDNCTISSEMFIKQLRLVQCMSVKEFCNCLREPMTNSVNWKRLRNGRCSYSMIALEVTCIGNNDVKVFYENNKTV